jgi:hypothetical protein
MKRCIVAIPSSHSWFWLQTCVACLQRFPPKCDGVECKVVVVDNSWDWSPAIKGITQTRLGNGIHVWNNQCNTKNHASGLDEVVRHFDFDYLFTLETDVAVLRDEWLPWFMEMLDRDPHWFAVGHWHHEQFINPSCTLYRGSVLRDMLAWSRQNSTVYAWWGENFEKVEPLLSIFAEDMQGPFAERRGWPTGTKLNERPTGLTKGPGHYEPGQSLYHWARDTSNGDWGYLACRTETVERSHHWPVQTLYGIAPRNYEAELETLLAAPNGACAAHFWLGTGALNILKHNDIDPASEKYRAFALPREARFWRQAVPADVQEETLKLIRKYGWYTKSLRGPEICAEDRKAVQVIQEYYRQGGVEI